MKLRRVTPGELLLLAEAQLMLVICQIVKWQRPLGRLIEKDATAGDAAGRVNGMERADRDAVLSVAWAVTRAGRYGMFRPRCLVRSLAMQRMLRRRGIVAGTVNIGVRTQNGAFQAHAWVELNGIVVGDTMQHVGSFTRVNDLRLVEL